MFYTKKMTAPSASAAKLSKQIDDLIATIDANNKLNTAATNEIQVTLGTILTRLDTLEQVLGDKKKPIKAVAKKADDVAVESTATKVVPNNVINYFKQRYSESAEFRQKYRISDEHVAKMAAHGPVVKAKDEAKKLTAQAAFTWAEMTKSHADAKKQVVEEFKQVKDGTVAVPAPLEQLELDTTADEL